MRPSLIQVLQIAALVLWTLAGLQAATQMAARLLAYDPHLGAPLFEMAGTPIYPPWRFALWRFTFGQYAPTTFAASYPAILLGMAAGASNAVMLLFVPDATAYRDPFALAARPAPIMPFLPSPTARLARLIADAEAEIMTAKDDAMKCAARIGEAEAAKQLAEAKEATALALAQRPPRGSENEGAARPAFHHQAMVTSAVTVPRPKGSGSRANGPRDPAADPAQPCLPFDGVPAERPRSRPPSDVTEAASASLASAHAAPIPDRRHRMDFL